MPAPDHLLVLGFAILGYAVVYWSIRYVARRYLGRRADETDGSADGRGSGRGQQSLVGGPAPASAPGTCPHCGVDNDPDFTFCRSCLAEL